MELGKFLFSIFKPAKIGLIEAVKENDVERVKICLRIIGYPVNIQDNKGKTPLMHAVRNKNKLITALLLKRGANPNICDKNYNTPLFFAVRSPQIVKKLLQHGANPNVVNDLGRTPLMWAACFNQTESLKQLLAYGANINQQDHDGCTAALWAAEYSATNTLKELKKQGADLSIKTRNGADIGYIAKILNDSRVEDIIKTDGSLEPPHNATVISHKKTLPLCRKLNEKEYS